MSANWAQLRAAAVDLPEQSDGSHQYQHDPDRPYALLSEAAVRAKLAQHQSELSRHQSELARHQSKIAELRKHYGLPPADSKNTDSPVRFVPDDPGRFGRFMEGVGFAAYNIMTGFSVWRAEAEADAAEARVRAMLATIHNSSSKPPET